MPLVLFSSIKSNKETFAFNPQVGIEQEEKQLQQHFRKGKAGGGAKTNLED